MQGGEGRRPVTAYTVVVVAAALTIASIWFFVQRTSNDIRAVQNEWANYEQDAAQRTVLLDDLHSTIGYGGLIHNFKNFILRGTDQYRKQVEQDIKRAGDIIARFRTLNLEEAEKAAILDVENVLTDYQFMLEVVQAEVASATPIPQIDNLVRVDDTAALAALRTLTKITVDRGKHLLQSTGSAINNTVEKINLGYILIPLTISFSFVVFVLINRQRMAEVELWKAKTVAERHSMAKSDFLANMSHELRTPLNAVIGFSRTMKEEVFGPLENDKYREYLDDIHNSGQHLLELINDILDASAIEAGALELHEENVSITEVVKSSIRLINPRAENGQVNVISFLEPGTLLIYADERRVRQIVINLLSNAVKFTPEGGKVVVDSLFNVDGSFSVFVSDTGYGMNDEEIATAMSKFGQVDSGHNRKHEGTGLGLPLTKGLMERHGGILEIDSLEGYGTMVTATFPKERVVLNV